MEQIKKYIDQIATISEEDWFFFKSKLQRRILPKKTIFLKINQIENHISFIESGVVRIKKRRSAVNLPIKSPI